MIPKSLGIGAIMLFAAACGGEAKPAPSESATRLTKACLDGGGDPANCECQGAKLDELKADPNISADVIQAHLLSSEGKDEEADAIMAKVSPKEFFEGLSAVGEVMHQCDAKG